MCIEQSKKVRANIETNSACGEANQIYTGLNWMALEGRT